MTRVRARTLTWMSVIVVPAALAWTQATQPLRLQPASRLWVKGTSTVRSFECTAKTFDATVAATVPDAIQAVLAGEKGVGAVELKVPADSLDCNNGTMNGHMLKALKAKEFKDIAFTLDSYALAKATEGTRATLTGTLTLGGVQKAITFEVDAKPGPDGALMIAGTYPLNMKEFSLKPPSLMLGTMKVHELVNVNFELLLKP